MTRVKRIASDKERDSIQSQIPPQDQHLNAHLRLLRPHHQNRRPAPPARLRHQLPNANYLLLGLFVVSALVACLAPHAALASDQAEPVKAAAAASSEPAADQAPAKSPGADGASVDAKEPLAARAAVPQVKEQPEKVEAKSSDSLSEQAHEKASEAPSARKSRAESSVAADNKSAAQEASKAADKAAPKASEAATTKAPQPASSSSKPGKSSAQQQQQKSSGSSSKSKLLANLGTVTSTGSGGHYLSKHDAYSAIAEKHGALAHDAMRKSDKRQLMGGHNSPSSGGAGTFGGIKKASGGLVGDVLGPFKGMSDSGLARTLGASMRSIMKSKYSVPAYVASALLGAVALMAFYESPTSPLPVPPLPNPPIGRFPPEMPNLPVGTQVPFRGQQLQQYLNSQQNNYNQRSGSGTGLYAQAAGSSQGGQQQVLFPGNMNAQQRQMSAQSPTQAAAQMAANLISSAKQQVAQRKSSPDYDLLSSSRSFFASGSPSSGSSGKASGNQKQASSFLSYFGLGGGAASPAQASSSSSLASSLNNNNNNNDLQASASTQQLSGAGQIQNAANMPSASSMASFLEPKGAGPNGQLSNSHLVNKVRSYFSRSPASSTGSHGSSSSLVSTANANANPYDQYQRMSFVQALMKDTAFIPGFLSPTRKSSPSSSSSSSQPIARMQVDSASSQPIGGLIKLRANPNQQQHQPSTGYGFVKAADRIAHALLETFGSSMAQRSHSASSHHSSSAQDVSARKASSSDDSVQAPSLASATTSLLSDIMSSYSSNGQNNEQPSAQAEQQPSSGKSSSSQLHSASNSQQHSAQTQEVNQAASSRSGDDEQQKQNSHSPSSSSSSSVPSAKSAPNTAAVAPASSDASAHVRKTRSIGFEYPLEIREQPQQPSRAAQINNVIDFVADSYAQNRLLFNFVMNQVGLSQAVPYVEQILASGNEIHH